MNKDRRAEISDIIEKMRKLGELLDEVKEDVERVRDEEQEYFDNMPEGLQNGDRGQQAQSAIDELEYVWSALDDYDSDGLISSLETAAE